MLDWLSHVLSMDFVVLLASAMPIIEMRGAIPVGLAGGLSPGYVFLLANLGSLIPVPFILGLIRPVLKWMKTVKIFAGIANKLTDIAHEKSDKINKYGFWGLLILVALPLPGAGIWTGCLAAAVLEMKLKHSIPAILLGNIIAGIVIITVSLGAFGIVGNLF